jgi:hypothetical protein
MAYATDQANLFALAGSYVGEILNGAEPADRHYVTRGCIFGFNADLNQARLSVLSGHLCGLCAAQIEKATPKQVVDDC